MVSENEKDTENIHQVLASENKKASVLRTLRTLGILAIVAAVVYVGVQNLRSTDTETTYTTIDAKRGDLTVLVTATGALKPLNQVDVGTEVSGTIESIAVDFNDRVTANQVLAVLDRDQLEAKLRQSRAALALAEASVLEAEATVTETRKRLSRVQGLIAKKLSTPEELDATVAAFARAEAGQAVAKAKVDQAQAQLDSDRRALEKAVIRSPIDGIVLERRVETGQTVAATLQTPILFTLAESLKQMELNVDVDEADVGKVVVGLPATFTVDAYPDQVFPATIKTVRYAPKSADGVVTYETLLAVDNANLLLRPGMTATAEIVVEYIKDAVLIANAALRFSPPPTATDGSAPKRSGLLDRLRKRQPTKPSAPIDTASDGRPHVWVLRDGLPMPVAVEIGATNGVQTELIGGEIEPGTPLLIDMHRAGG